MGKTIGKQTSQRWHGISLLAGFCLLCVLTEAQLTMSISAGLGRISCFLALTGFLVAGIFTYASLHESVDQKEMISPLYSADLIGGCLGSLLGSLILIPLAGMDVTIWGMLLLAVFSILLV